MFKHFCLIGNGWMTCKTFSLKKASADYRGCIQVNASMKEGL